jgi:hypothetical protein
MTIEEILADIQHECGDNWPRGAVTRLVNLRARLASVHNDEDVEEFRLLFEWVARVIEASAAFAQASLIGLGR